MLQTIITCDMCGTDERGPYPKEVPGKYWKGEVAGGRWYKLAIYNEREEAAAVWDNPPLDVCPECAEKLADQLGLDELPPLTEDEEDSDGSSLTIVTNPAINNPPWPYTDDGTAWKWDKYQWTNTSSATPLWPIDFTA